MARLGDTAVRLVAVTGLRAEAAVARRLGLEAVCGGGDAAATRAAIRGALDAGAAALLSFGIAGGLAPGLPPGTLVVADRVDGAERQPMRLSVAGRRGTVAGASAIAATAAQKALLHTSSGALCVDLETALVASAGVPYAVLRAIGDPAGRDLPAAALVGLRPDGSPDIPAVLRSLALAPGQLPALIRAALDTRAALRALAAVGRIELV